MQPTNRFFKGFSRKMFEFLFELHYINTVETKHARCVSTPYTDRRFSAGVPLKEYMHIRFKKSGLTADIPGLYFDMGIEHYGYGIRIYKQTAHGMDTLRGKILENPEKFSLDLNAALSAGFTVKGEKYKKDHFPQITDCSAKEILNRSGFYIEKAAPICENVFSYALADELSYAFRTLKPIFDIL